MRILYAIQLNGNGHITRSVEIIRQLKAVGLSVDIMVSGSNSNINIPFKIKYKFTGLSIYYNKNGYVNWWKTIKNLRLFRLIRDIRNFSTKNYDLVISDFEPVSAWSSRRNKVTSLGISNQNTLLLDLNKSNSFFSKTFIKIFSPCDRKINLHYHKSDITLQPVIDERLLKSKNKKQNKIIIYLPSIKASEIVKKVTNYKGTKWFIFTDEVTEDINIGQIKLLKIDRENFKKNILTCSGVITASGFSTTSEALVLGKKLWSIPLKGQWEQKCNSKFLSEMGVFTNDFTKENLKIWMNDYNTVDYKYKNPLSSILKEILSLKKTKQK